MSNYSKAEKHLHKLYLSNYFLSKSSLELEEIIHGNKAKQTPIEEYVFITGLARSGTTALMNKIFTTEEYASLQYSNMPILLSPNLWNKKLKIAKHERAHKDGIIIDGNSPEEFDEYFWKVFLNDSYIKDGLLPHEVDEKVLAKYLTYVSLICHSKGKQKYISKNNNNILRLSSLNKIQGSKIIILFRDPLSHASSLMKLHKSFSENQKDDPFVLDYFNYLGHHEFGLGHKPFLLTDNFINNKDRYTPEDLNYWLQIWINYYDYLLANFDDNWMVVSFEDLIEEPNKVYDHLKANLNINAPLTSDHKHIPTKYKDISCNIDLKERALKIYDRLCNIKAY
ncbi:sulfotransferase [Muriicola sp. Z0-33]|uniref:sulfotransferase n=1 Tax=Muriicola sp. Z0-33 TaxID=2816957 RepID=UPI0022382B6F|nr:sulfotransferase [Muriicola sp. Z0-33]MCW5515588.1 sulfotransferase [Muriicola sp. Z0-33]